jgi:hypothetical protein
MKILFTGGGSGGHFYPIIAVAEAINDATRDRKLLEPQLYYAAPDPYDRETALANNITFVPTAAGRSVAISLYLILSMCLKPHGVSYEQSSALLSLP